jgi:predicted RNase H-like nuclease (RuvC/YqgF family)
MTRRKKEIKDLREKIVRLEHVIDGRDQDIEELHRSNEMLHSMMEEAKAEAETQRRVAESAIRVNDLLCEELKKDDDFFTALRAAVLLLDGKAEIRQTVREPES